jgi:peroxiredoxin
MKTTRRVGAAIVALALGVGALVMVQSVGAPQPAPDVAFTLLDGRPSSIQALRGKVVLVNFWATSCAPCVQEMPQFVDTHNRFKARGLQTLAVAMSYDPPTQVIRFAQARQLPFDVVIDNVGAVARGFGDVSLTPTTVLINKRGQIVKRFVGEPDFAVLHRWVESLLAEV